MDNQFNQVFGNIDLDIKRAEPGKVEAGFPVVSGPSIESVSEQQQLSANLLRTANLPAIDTLRVVKKGTTKAVINNVGGQSDTTITHNLGFTPLPFAFVTQIITDAGVVLGFGARNPWDFTSANVITGIVDLIRYTEITDTTLKLRAMIPIASSGSGTTTYTVEWFLVQLTQAQ